MTGLFAKASTLVQAVTHSALDKASDANSIAVYEQNIREFSDNRKKLESSLYALRFDLQTAQNTLASHQANDADMTANARLLMSANGGNPNDAQKAEAKRLGGLILALRAAYPADEKLIADKQAEITKLEQAVDAVNQKEVEAKAKISALKTAAANAKAMTGVTQSLEQIGTIGSNLSSIDSIGTKIERDQSVASQAFDRALGDIHATPSQADALKVDDFLKSL